MMSSSSSSSSSNSPCAACKFLRRKCTPGCVFAPYFPPDHPEKFSNVHRVFGASNVAKILNDLPPAQREDAVNSLAFEADARLRDPVYGCVGYISILQNKLKQLQHDIYSANKELVAYLGPAAAPYACGPLVQGQQGAQQVLYQGTPTMGGGVLPQQMVAQSHPHQLMLQREQQQQQQQRMMEALSMSAAATTATVVREQEFFRGYDHQQQQQQPQSAAEYSGGGHGYDVVGGYNSQMGGGLVSVAGPPPELALQVPQAAYDGAAQQKQPKLEMELLQEHHHQQQELQLGRRAGSTDRCSSSGGGGGGGGGVSMSFS